MSVCSNSLFWSQCRKWLYLMPIILFLVDGEYLEWFENSKDPIFPIISLSLLLNELKFMFLLVIFTYFKHWSSTLLYYLSKFLHLQYYYNTYIQLNNQTIIFPLLSSIWQQKIIQGLPKQEFHALCEVWSIFSYLPQLFWL